MVPLTALAHVWRDALGAWTDLSLAGLQFAHRDAAQLTLAAVVGLSIAVLALRLVGRSAPTRHMVSLPALPSSLPGSPLALVRHAPLVLFFLGLACFVVALGDPLAALRREEVSYPGRRICLLIDASSSMMAPFKATTLNPGAPTEIAFTTGVEAAGYFVRLRMKRPYHDLLALVEFGDEAYVVTPFTTDYDNILLSLSLIGDQDEWRAFPDQGTLIAQAIEQSLALFQAFDALKAAGNALVIFSDGQDAQVSVHGRSIDSILNRAVETRTPVYFIRTGYSQTLGVVVPDAIWKPAVERTGGKFYVASNEDAVLNAIYDIDHLATGTIETTRYTIQEPRFAPFALAAFGVWTLALGLRLTVPACRRFP